MQSDNTDVREGNNFQTAKPKGASAELLGFAVIALAVMGLLATGYARTSRVETAQTTKPAGVTTGMSQGMAQPAGTAEQPKQYQPVNLAPDTRAAPTSSDTGAGPASGPVNGSTTQPKP